MSLCLGYGLFLGARSRGGGWTPDDLGGALIGWIDAEDASTLSLTGNLVNSIRDKRNPTIIPAQAVTAKKPIFNATGVNGRPGMEVDGTDDILIYTGAVPYPAGAAGSEIWGLVRQDTPGGGLGTVFCSTNGMTGAISRRIGSISVSGVRRVWAVAGNGSSSTAVYVNTVDFTGIHVARGVFGPANVTAYADSSAGVSAAVVPASGSTHCLIGGPNDFDAYFKGCINSLYLINPAHANWTPENVANMWAFLKSRGGIA